MRVRARELDLCMQLVVTIAVFSPSSSSAAAAATVPSADAARISASNVAVASTTPRPLVSSDASLSELSSSPPSTHSVMPTNPKKPLWHKLLPSFSNVKSAAISNATAAHAAATSVAEDQFSTKDIKVPFAWNPGVTHQFQAWLSFSKLPLIGAKGGHGNAATSHRWHKGHGLAHGGDQHQDGDGEQLDTVDTSESAYDDVNREQMAVFRQDQQYENAMDDGLTVKWQHWLKSPVSVWQKVQKLGVDAVGLGPLYGTGQYSKHKQHGAGH